VRARSVSYERRRDAAIRARRLVSSNEGDTTMRLLALTRRSALAGLALTTLLTAAANASAAQYAFYTQEKPGISCRTTSANVTPWGSELTNHDSQMQDLWCPLEQTGRSTSLWVDVSTGWANSSSCTLSVLSTGNNSGWFMGPSGVNRNTQTNTDGVAFNQPPGSATAIGSTVTCVMPPGTTLYDYNQRIQIYFDWTSW
jgi:hypothetical protein